VFYLTAVIDIVCYWDSGSCFYWYDYF